MAEENSPVRLLQKFIDSSIHFSHFAVKKILDRLVVMRYTVLGGSMGFTHLPANCDIGPPNLITGVMEK